MALPLKQIDPSLRHTTGDPLLQEIVRPLHAVSDEVNQAGQPKTEEPDHKPYDWAQEPEDHAVAGKKLDTSYIPEDPKPAPTNEDGTVKRRSHHDTRPLWHQTEYQRRATEPGYEVGRQLGKFASRFQRPPSHLR